MINEKGKMVTTGTATATTQTGATTKATAAGTGATSATTASSTATSTYKYTPKPPTQLQGQAGWQLPKDRAKASHLTVDILQYRRQYGSQGIDLFVDEWLVPTLKNITDKLKDDGYTVAPQIILTDTGAYNFLFDVSKDGKTSNVLYAAHYDTVDTDVGYRQTRYNKTATQAPATNQRTKKRVDVVNGIAKLNKFHVDNTNVGCLGADDGAGLGVMLHLMYSGVLGGYCFTTGEECGGIGASAIAEDKMGKTFLSQYDISIEIDRRGFNEVVYEQGVGECASKEFAQWMCDQLKMGHVISPNGSYTDVADFAGIIRENVNISAGYVNAHSEDEQVSLIYLDALADRLKGLDWSKAVIKREAGDFGVTAYSYGGYGGYYGGTYPRVGSAYNVLAQQDLSDIAKIAMFDVEFLRYIIDWGVSSYDDLNNASIEYFAMEWVDVLNYYRNPTEV